MGTVIKVNRGNSVDVTCSSKDKLFALRKFLPQRICRDIEKLSFALGENSRIEEIRIRSDAPIYLTVGGKAHGNVVTDSSASRAEIAEILGKMCEGSLYAYSESISKGYISLGNGIRVGVCGKASAENGRILGVYDISSMNIRLPFIDAPVDAQLTDAVRKATKKGEGVLIFSPPAGGKTTLLRGLAKKLACGREAMRVCVVDSREELFDGKGNEGMIDLLSGYPQAEGIKTATAFMNPQLIACDEISETDAEAILKAQNCGVPLLATAHGESLKGILQRDGIRRLHEKGVFGLYVRIKRRNGLFCHELYTEKEIENECCGSLLTGI